MDKNDDFRYDVHYRDRRTHLGGGTGYPEGKNSLKYAIACAEWMLSNDFENVEIFDYRTNKVLFFCRNYQDQVRGD